MKIRKVSTADVHISRPLTWIGLIHYCAGLIFSIKNFENFEYGPHVRMTALDIHLLFSELLGGSRVIITCYLICNQVPSFLPRFFFSNFIVVFCQWRNHNCPVQVPGLTHERLNLRCFTDVQWRRGWGGGLGVRLYLKTLSQISRSLHVH